jgi:hypothetical protein
MWREAFLCGVGMAIDLSGGHYSQSQSSPTGSQARIAQYWQSVGDALRSSISSERPHVEEVTHRQLQLNLDPNTGGKE